MPGSRCSIGSPEPTRASAMFAPSRSIPPSTARQPATLSSRRSTGYAGRVFGHGDSARQRTRHRARNPRDGQRYYTRAMTMDHYEVLREFIDDVDRLSGSLVLVVTDEAFVDDTPRGAGGIYAALRTRVMDRRPRQEHRQSGRRPGAALLEGIAHGSQPTQLSHRPAGGGGSAKRCPEQGAVRELGCNQPRAEQRFVQMLEGTADDQNRPDAAPGMLVSGDFGAGKSHLLEHLEHLALSRNFVCSRVAISKETPLYDLGKVFSSAMENGRIPDRGGRFIEELSLAIDQRSARYEAFSRWADEAASNGLLSPIFPASLPCVRALGRLRAERRYRIPSGQETRFRLPS